MSDLHAVTAVEVRAWGREVGAAARVPNAAHVAFEYSPEWIETRRELAPLHMPARPGTYEFPYLAPGTFHHLPALLADALPDRFGHALTDSWLAARGVRPEDVSSLDRLAYLGTRAMGALEFHPPTGDVPHADSALALADLVTAARSALRGELADGPARTEAIQQLISVGTSAGGARPKAVVAFDPATSRIRSGQVDAPSEFEHWLVKLDGVGTDPTREPAGPAAGRGHGIVEQAYHLMAVDAGISMSECRLLPEGPRVHFMTRRFDRTPDGARIHMASLCALAHLDFNLAGAHGYEQYLDTVVAMGLGRGALEQAFRRAVFNVAAINRDDHTKNLAFLLPEDGEWQLAPAFDVTYAHNPTGRWTRTHQMTVGGKGEDILWSDLVHMGDLFGVPAHREVIDDVRAAVARWPEHAAAAGLDDEKAAAIAEAHRDLGPR